MPASKEVVFYGGLEYGLNAEREIWFSFQDVLENGFKLSGHLQWHRPELTELNEHYEHWWADYAKVAGTKQTAPCRSAGTMAKVHFCGLKRET